MKNLLNTVMSLLVVGTGQVYAQNLGEPAPDFKLNLIEPDSTFMLSAQEGKVVFVYLFGNGCPFCIASGPTIESSIFEVYKENPEFTAIGVDTWDNSSNEASVKGFRDKTGITFPLAVKAGFVATDFETTYDRLMVIDKNGILVHKGVIVAGNDIPNAKDVIDQSLSVTNLDVDSESPKLNVYPNPVSDVLHIETGDASISGILLYDITGKQLHHIEFSGLTESFGVEVSLKHLEPGIYFYSIPSDGKLFNGKLLIQR